MYKLMTKEARINSQNVQFELLIKGGYTREDYKGLKIFIKNEGKYFTLKVFKDDASHAIQYMNYHTEERREQAIEGYKSGYDRQKAYKEEQKVKNKGYKSSHAAASAAIRAELKTNFPTVKFSVTSESYSMGNSVHISWTDGPTVKQVEEFSSKYQYGHFNGMEDIYENTNSRDDIPQAKYVSESRTMSKEAEESIITQLSEYYGAQYFNDMDDRDKNRLIYEKFTETDYQPQPTEKAQAAAPKVQTEGIKSASIEVIEYSDKSIAVTGTKKTDTDLIYKFGKNGIGGIFNPRLSCGAGWIFPKTKTEQVINAIKEYVSANKATAAEPIPEEKESSDLLMIAAPQEAEEETPILPTPETNIFNLDYFKIIWHEGRHIEGATFENVIFKTWEEVQKAFIKLWEVNEKGQDGGYTKVKCEMKFTDMEVIVERIDITNKIGNGDFNPTQEHILSYIRDIADEPDTKQLKHPELEAAHPLNICDPESPQYDEALREYNEDRAKHYGSLEDIKEAAANGMKISISNLAELNSKKSTSHTAHFFKSGDFTLFANAE